MAAEEDRGPPEPDPEQDRIAEVLLPGGDPEDAEREEFFNLYKLMVESSERLVARRQTVNTFFLSANGALLTAIGLVVRAGGDERLTAAAVAILGLAGLVLSYSWRSLLKSFGSLNGGKFAIINRMEKFLAASIYDAEWEALGRGQDDKKYKPFTKSEANVPLSALAIYCILTVISLGVVIGWWSLA